MDQKTQEAYKELKELADSETGGPFGFLQSGDNILRLVQDPRSAGAHGFYAETYSIYDGDKTTRYVVFALVKSLGDKTYDNTEVMPVIIPKTMRKAMIDNLAGGVDIVSAADGRAINIQKSGTGVGTRYNLLTLNNAPVKVEELTWPEETIHDFAAQFATRSENYASKQANVNGANKVEKKESESLSF